MDNAGNEECFEASWAVGGNEELGQVRIGQIKLGQDKH